ncbi:MAG: tetratricopeptide repeat protein [Bacteroidales bacterium]|jgi:tetratricopeptide (TPR) repeat protein|nr:tetratricopeptide repeat protein [Bacteroidales bacterium]
MSKSEEKKGVIVNVEAAVSKITLFFEKNSKIIYYIVGAIVVIVAGYFGVKYLYIEPQEKEASAEMFFAQRYFESDSLNAALNGDGQHFGFIDIIDNYGITEQANLAHYYAGLSYLKLGQFDEAVEHLSDFSTSEPLAYILSRQALGDACLELGDTDKAIETYLKTAKKYQNDYFTPQVLFRAGIIYESIKSYGKALDIFKQIREEYPQSQEARDMDKYIAECEAALQ